VEAIDEKIKLPQKPCFLFQVVWHQEVKGTGVMQSRKYVNA
jgi:hypothetical protein